MFLCCCEIQQEHKMKLTSSSYYKVVFFLPFQKILLSFIKKHTNFILGERQPPILAKILETEQTHHQIGERKHSSDIRKGI